MSLSTLSAGLALAALLAGATTPTAQAPASTAAAAAQADLAAEVMAVGAVLFGTKGETRCKPVDARLDRLAAAPGFDALPADHRRLALMMVLACAPPSSPKAVAAATRLVPIVSDPDQARVANMTLMFDAQARQDAGAFAAAVNRVVDTDPEILSELDPAAFGWAQVALQENPVPYADYLTHLRAVPWLSPMGRSMSDNTWALALARMAVESGDRTKAKALLDRAEEPYIWLSVAQDRRFAALWPDLEAEGRFDWIKVQTAALESRRERARREPKLLIHVVGQLEALRALERYDEALSLGQDYIARMKRRDAFEDVREQRAWLLNNHAYTLFDLGRHDEADKAMADAAGLDDGVSQRINRAELLIDSGAAAHALKVLATVDEKQSSPYGVMWRDASQACAKAQLGDLAAARALAQAMTGRWKDNPAALTKALVCARQDDEAAELYVRRLDDPAARAEALEAFQDGRAPPTQSPLNRAFHDRLAAVQARPEVQAAVARWGRALTLPLAGTYWGRI